MTYFRHFFIDGQYYGSGEDKIRFVHAEAQEPMPYAMFCPTCGEIWARMPVENSQREWRIIGGYCEKHPGVSPYVVHGSLILAWEPDLYDCMPPEMLKREFELHLRLWEKEIVERS
jgi:hypothetical protein